jgi:epoxyqueuosine reductase
MRGLSLETLRSLASQAGLQVLSVTSSAELEEGRLRLKEWQDAGLAADMGYMNRPPELLTTPQGLLSSARSIVVVAVLYDRSPRPLLEPGFGRIARYAWGRDYHKVLRRRLEHLVELVKEYRGQEPTYRVFSDSVPLLERALAERSGLAFIGKNTMAIIPKQGSFFFIGEVLWDVDVEMPSATGESAAHCGSCSNCLTQCPTGAFVKERTLDASKCISYLTIEKRGVLSFDERAWIGEWLFGCDVCQEVCPFNFVSLKKKSEASVPELSADAGIGPMISLERVLGLTTDKAFTDTFQGTAIMRAKRVGLLRNAAVVAANTHAAHLMPVLRRVAESDPSSVIQRHALWAYAVVADREGSAATRDATSLIDRAAKDPDRGLLEEVSMIRSQLRNFA